MTGHKKAPSPSTLAGDQEGAKGQGIEALGSRLDRYAEARRGTESIIPHIESVAQSAQTDSPDSAEADKVLPLLKRCGTKLRFRHYYRPDELRLVEARSCDKHLLCPHCAIRRMSRTLSRYMDRYEQVGQGREAWLLTVTVRNGEDLEERFRHLRESWKTWNEKRRNARKGRTSCALAPMEGAVYSYEFTNKGNGWHPHLHALVLVEPGCAPSQSALQAEWEKITGDSFMVDLRAVDEPQNGFLEVLKYSLKFGELAPADNWHAYMVLRGKRLLGAWGDFYGVPEPEGPDEDPLEGEPYLELVYRWAQEAGYQLEATEYHEPEAEAGGDTGPPSQSGQRSCRRFCPRGPSHPYRVLSGAIGPHREPGPG